MLPPARRPGRGILPRRPGSAVRGFAPHLNITEDKGRHHVQCQTIAGDAALGGRSGGRHHRGTDGLRDHLAGMGAAHGHPDSHGQPARVRALPGRALPGHAGLDDRCGWAGHGGAVPLLLHRAAGHGADDQRCHSHADVLRLRADLAGLFLLLGLCAQFGDRHLAGQQPDHLCHGRHGLHGHGTRLSCRSGHDGGGHRLGGLLRRQDVADLGHHGHFRLDRGHRPVRAHPQHDVHHGARLADQRCGLPVAAAGGGAA